MSKSTTITSLDLPTPAVISTEDVYGDRCTLEGGKMVHGPESTAEAEVIIVDAVREMTYYPGAYDPNNICAPTCFSFDAQMPHPDAEEPQHESCADCPQNQWGSAGNGKGKACKERVKLSFIPHNVGDYGKAVPLYLRTPVTSTKNYLKYAASLPTKGISHPMQAHTRMSFSRHKTYSNVTQVEFTYVSKLDDEDVAQVLTHYPISHANMTKPYGDEQE